jgi:hypothetical protein
MMKYGLFSKLAPSKACSTSLSIDLSMIDRRHICLNDDFQIVEENHQYSRSIA